MSALLTPVFSDGEIADKPFGDLTIEQLYDCATLLALSIVDHRAKFGVVPIERSASKMHDAMTAGYGSNDLFAEGKKTLEEALTEIKTLSSPRSKHRRDGLNKKTNFAEKRQQIRINISAPIHVVPLDTTTPVKAKLGNISWGGATFHVDQCIGEVGECIQVTLPSFRGRQITVHAEIIRASYDSDGQLCVVRFSKLRTSDEVMHQHLLEFLANSDDDSQEKTNATLARRIDIHYDDPNDMRATLEAISSGELDITLPEAMERGLSLLVAVSAVDQECELLLRARVVRLQEVCFSDLEMFQVGLVFEHPTKDIKKQVSKMLRTLECRHN